MKVVLTALVTLGVATSSAWATDTTQRQAVVKKCPDVIEGVYFYRTATRQWQSKLGLKPAKSSFNASTVKSCRYVRWVAHTWQRRSLKLRKKYEAHQKWLRSMNTNPRAAICYVFGSYCSAAISVSYCETGGTFWVGSSNGQYLGLFQMGSHERAVYGHGADALTQAQAAWNYFNDSGRDWSPWECKP